MDGGVTNTVTGPALALLNSVQTVVEPPKPLPDTISVVWELRWLRRALTPAGRHRERGYEHERSQRVGGGEHRPVRGSIPRRLGQL
jgi:hypothetical protein